MKTERRGRQYFFGSVFAAWNVLLFLGPLAILCGYGFFRYEEYRIIRDFTLDNYIKIFSSEIFYLSLFNSLKLGLISAAVIVPLSFLTAYFIYTRIRPQRQKFVVLILLLPLLTNVLLRSYSWSLILSDSGVVNWTLARLGLISEPLPLLFSEWGILIGLVSYISPMVILIFYFGLTRLKENTLQASLDLGAGEFLTVVRVVLPQVKKFIFMGSLLTFMLSIADYVHCTVLGGGKIYTYSINIVDAFNINDIPQASALGMIMLFVIMLLIFGIMSFVRIGDADE